MMKIGILTFHWSNNYGAVLQAFALKKALSNYTRFVEIIPYQPRRKFLWRYLGRNPQITLYKWFNLYKTFVFSVFRRKLLQLPYWNHSSIQFVHKYTANFDFIFLGSDQIWNPSLLNLNDLSVYNGIVSNKSNIISYAASTGQQEKNSCEFKDNLSICKIFELGINSSLACSVRETTSKKFLESLAEYNKEIQIVCDPVFLLDKEDYKQLIHSGIRKNRKHFKYMFSYILHDDFESSESDIIKLAKIKKLNMISCNSSTINFAKNLIIPSPVQWLDKIVNSDLVYTNSFHCIAFCMIFHKRFVIRKLPRRLESQNGRLISLIQSLMPNYSEKIMLDGHIDWASVDNRIESVRKYSFEYINYVFGQY